MSVVIRSPLLEGPRLAITVACGSCGRELRRRTVAVNILGDDGEGAAEAQRADWDAFDAHADDCPSHP